MITKTLGGDRLGSGNKMKVHLHNYGRSSHNLGRAWRSTIAPGTLTPFLVEPALPGDTFDIDLTTLVRTMPTNGPVFGSFKMQLDVFSVPMRLYNAQLHNNALGIGLNMEKVLFPQIKLAAYNPRPENGDMNIQQINPSSLLAYLGIRGLGKDPDKSQILVSRKFNAMPMLAYWDIYKNYYANKQEEIGMVIDNQNVSDLTKIISISRSQTSTGTFFDTIYNDMPTPGGNPNNDIFLTVNQTETVTIRGQGLDPDTTVVYIGSHANPGSMPIQEKTLKEIEEYFDSVEYQGLDIVIYKDCKQGFSFSRKNKETHPAPLYEVNTQVENRMKVLNVKKFPLENIDLIREMLLTAPKTEPLVLDNQNTQGAAPYDSVIGNDEDKWAEPKAINEMAGLGLKTYMSDRFNNWLSTEWIDGANGISAVTAVNTTSGSFTIDSLNLAQKVYNMLNRIAISGGSYTDWQEAVYGESSMKLAESPIYMGGLSSEIVFNEVVSTADSSTMNGEEQPLGTLAGRGANANQKGGKIRIKVQEPSYIMGIISITPRIDYSQGNKWWVNLETMNDLHKPALDGIGFQELITDEMAAWDTNVNMNGEVTFKSAGKQPAWIHYMTATNECYGNFAMQDQEMFMTLNRRYEPDAEGNIKDLTTYIDPSKYNYAFAVQELKAQNFWVQIAMDVTARRKMSAKLIPNL